jgi:preprotein translocase subunit SecB
MDEQKRPYKLHAIQLKELRISELSIKVDLSVPRDAEIGGFAIETGRSDYDTVSHQIQVKMRVAMGMDETENAPFQLVVELNSMFSVDESNFNVQYVHDWAEKNAPLVLYPYIREHVYTLTSRAGFPEALLPLIEIPTFRNIQAAPTPP